jgi:hypothetical protein
MWFAIGEEKGPRATEKVKSGKPDGTKSPARFPGGGAAEVAITCPVKPAFSEVGFFFGLEDSATHNPTSMCARGKR